MAACEPVNPGGHATWGVTVKRGDRIIAEESGYVGDGPKMSNNVAEYAGLLRVLEIVSGTTGRVIIRGGWYQRLAGWPQDWQEHDLTAASRGCSNWTPLLRKDDEAGKGSSGRTRRR
jgi:hypothetical protein